jgi:radical SAM superfamily enzyme YgiQ (UPF0313 family)
VEEAIDNEGSFEDIPNLLFRTGNQIIQTDYQKRVKSVTEIHIPDMPVANDGEKTIKIPHEIFETKLQINNKCHWAACSYCGINTKYPSLVSDTTPEIKDFFSVINQVKNKNYKLLILQDEAISTSIARQIAQEKILQNNNLPWHYRSKIDKGFDDKLISTLADSKLVGIYFGLESINERVVGLMNKYKEIISPRFIEELADKLFAKNIHCHFCAIIGFPSETKEEIQQTLDFIKKIKTKHKAMTFTINIFMPDIASPLYTDTEKYKLEFKIPVPEDEYISNSILINRSIPYSELVEIKTNFILENITDSNSYITEVTENPNSLINFFNSVVDD